MSLKVTKLLNIYNISLWLNFQYLSKCSLIYVLKDGRIFESGTHDDLLSKNGEYFSLSSLGKLKVGSPDPMEGGEGKPPPNSNISYISPTAAVQNGKTGGKYYNFY